jgi:hypothetical protein
VWPAKAKATAAAARDVVCGDSGVRFAGRRRRQRLCWVAAAVAARGCSSCAWRRRRWPLRGAAATTPAARGGGGGGRCAWLRRLLGLRAAAADSRGGAPSTSSPNTSNGAELYRRTRHRQPHRFTLLRQTHASPPGAAVILQFSHVTGLQQVANLLIVPLIVFTISSGLSTIMEMCWHFIIEMRKKSSFLVSESLRCQPENKMNTSVRHVQGPWTA